MTWTGGDVCQKCHQEQIEKNIPPLRIKLYTLPCKKHGHPGRLKPHLVAWMDFYNTVAPYIVEGRLDHPLISKLCQETEIPFLKAFEMLSKIFKLVQEHADKNERFRAVHKEHAGQIH